MPTALLGRLKTIANLVIAAANDASQAIATDARILAFANACLRDVAKEEYWKKYGTLTVVAGTESYDLLTEFPDFLTLSQDKAAVQDITNNIILRPVQTIREYRITLIGQATGTAWRYWHHNNQLRLAPVPDAAGTLDILYCYSYGELSSRDVKLDIDAWVQDSGATGHFVDVADAALTLGEGNACPEVIEGLTVSMDAGEFVITDITGDGSGTGGVTLSAARPSADVLAVYDADLTNPAWPYAFDDVIAYFCLWKIFESDSTHSASDKLVDRYQAQYLNERNKLLSAALGPIQQVPYR